LWGFFGGGLRFKAAQSLEAIKKKENGCHLLVLLLDSIENKRRESHTQPKSRCPFFVECVSPTFFKKEDKKLFFNTSRFFPHFFPFIDDLFGYLDGNKLGLDFTT
jgi:hypothetical protein